MPAPRASGRTIMPMTWPMWRTFSARLALAADRAEQALAAPGAEQEVAAVAALEAEPVQVVGRLLARLALGVGGERLGMQREHLVAQPLVVGEVGRAERSDRGGARSPADVVHLDALLAGRSRCGAAALRSSE